MSERLSDERIAELIGERADYAPIMAHTVADILSALRELQDLRRYAAMVKEWMLQPVKGET